MKTSKLFVAAVLSGMMLVTTVSATEGDKPGNVSANASDAVRNQIVNALSDVSAIDQEVVIRFAVTDKKGFELLKVEGENKEVVDAVKTELATEKIIVPSEMTGLYSIKVRFSDSEVTQKTDASLTLRNEIANALSDVVVTEPASVKLAFSVENNSLKLKKVETSNKSLASKVEKALAESSIVAPAEFAGNYQVVVKF